MYRSQDLRFQLVVRAANLSVQWTARAEPLWQIVEKLKFTVFLKPVEALAAPDFCVGRHIRQWKTD